MTVVNSHPRIVTTSVDQEVRRLETYVLRMESRYEFPSNHAAKAVEDGQLKETAEVSKWLASYSVLMSLKGEPERGEGAGSHTTDTKASIRAAWMRFRQKA